MWNPSISDAGGSIDDVERPSSTCAGGRLKVFKVRSRGSCGLSVVGVDLVMSGKILVSKAGTVKVSCEVVIVAIVVCVDTMETGSKKDRMCCDEVRKTRVSKVRY